MSKKWRKGMIIKGNGQLDISKSKGEIEHCGQKKENKEG